MKPSSFRSISMSRLPSGRDKHQQEESMWNVFVQILLPLVLVVTFIAVLGIVRYKDVAENMTKRWNELPKDSQEDDYQRRKLIINLQKQKLINAIQEIRTTEERAFRLVKFIHGGNSIALNGTTIVDDDFRHLCEAVKTKVVDNASSYLQEIYSRVLTLSATSDPRQNQYRIQRRSEDRVEGGQEHIPITDEKVISDQNRSYIHNRIIEYADAIKETAVNVQSQVLIRLYNELLKKPEDLDKRSSELVHCMLAEPDQMRKEECAESFYRRMLGHVRSKVKDFAFLDQTWNQVSKLKM